jgi:hypothetical protein
LVKLAYFEEVEFLDIEMKDLIEDTNESSMGGLGDLL